jgi:hypothetical protein
MLRWKVLPLCALLAAGLLARADDPPQVEVARLTWQTYPSLLAETAARPDEMRWDQVRWKPSLFDALVEAQAKDKPIFIFMFNGDLRGVC